MATVENSLARLAKGSIFSKLDCNSGFWQIPINVESRNLTTFLSPQGRFRFCRLPFGLTSAPEIFQREMLRILVDIDQVIVHMDDILIASETLESHNKILKLVLDRIRSAGLTLNLEKCSFRKCEIKFLGSIINKYGLRADPKAIEGIEAIPKPHNIKTLQRFLGAINQYSKYTNNMSMLSKPLRELLLKDRVWIWDEAQDSAFKAVKRIIGENRRLARFNVELDLILSTDASQIGLGATLNQINKLGVRQLICVTSRSLTSAESRYACIER